MYREFYLINRYYQEKAMTGVILFLPVVIGWI